MLSKPWSLWIFALSVVNAFVLTGYQRNQSRNVESSPLLVKRATSPTDMSWISRWAAIGDSFTAGIGSGSLYSQRKPDYECSRYDYSYPAILNRYFGPAVKDFQFVACSGDKSVDINNQVINMAVYDQINYIKGNLDLVVLTAGGNDLCLSSIITTCIMFPWPIVTESQCTNIIATAQKNLDNILKGNIKNILVSLNDKMNTGGIVVYNMYAEFFNTDTDECATQQDWSFPKLPIFSGLSLTQDRRKKFNDLVTQINVAIQSVVDDISKDTTIRYKVQTSDWNVWPKGGVAGQMCEPGSTGKYPDPNVPDLQFFKPNSYVEDWNHDESKRSLTPEEEQKAMKQWEAMRKAYGLTDEDIYNSKLYLSPDPRAVARSLLDKRAPIPPNCPGDGQKGPLLGLGLPDKWGKFFHPNQRGHETIASFALETIIDMRADALGVDAPSCAESKDQFTCWQAKGRTAYANADQMNANYKDFCNGVNPPKDTRGWKWEIKYAEGTPDEHTILLQLTSDAITFNKQECLDSFNSITNSCDGNDPKNPMNWKFGGQRIKGFYTYEINPARHRVWPPITKPYGNCEGWYKVFFGNYKIHGAGWSTWDYGQQTLLPNIKGCLGNGVTAWKFEYYDKPDSDGYEWGASFNTPIWVRARCFANNKVAFASGGFTNGCKGND